ncbi:MAG: hypothetical protein R3B54_00015 [Bdellovibrionota bacterium]
MKSISKVMENQIRTSVYPKLALVVVLLCFSLPLEADEKSPWTKDRVATVGQEIFLNDMENRLEGLIDDVYDLKIRIERYDGIDGLQLERHIEYLQKQLGHAADLYLVLLDTGREERAKLEIQVADRITHVEKFVSYLEAQLS